MFDRLRLSVGLGYARFHFRKNPDQIVQFNGVISSAQRALVILPESAQDAWAITSVLGALRRRFSFRGLAVIAREDVRSILPDGNGYDVITYDEDDVNAWFVPRGNLLQKVKRSTFDLAVDLNLGFWLPSAFLCRASRAAIRVGFTKRYADQFYNLQIQTSQTDNLQLAYANLVNCLQMF